MSEEKRMLAEELIYEAAIETNQCVSKEFVHSLTENISTTFNYSSPVSDFGLQAPCDPDIEIRDLKRENADLKNKLKTLTEKNAFSETYVKEIRRGKSRKCANSAGSSAVINLNRS